MGQKWTGNGQWGQKKFVLECNGKRYGANEGIRMAHKKLTWRFRLFVEECVGEDDKAGILEN
jgi:hypothetical protein